jgi:hypothetical protein
LCALCILPLRSLILSNSIFSKSDNDGVIIDRGSMTQAKKAHVVACILNRWGYSILLLY